MLTRCVTAITMNVEGLQHSTKESPVKPANRLERPEKGEA